jgi:wyosine [tRNA(Phe)-imidazoG37] synthetase (radical SAM superfamily)
LTCERADYAPSSLIVEELRDALDRYHSGGIDWVTFVGSGEPTLHRDLGWMIRQVKAMTSIPVAVITNGSFLDSPAVRQEVSAADAILPSVDCGSESLFRAINRPHPAFSFERHINGLVECSREYERKFWLEVMLLANVNDTDEALRDIASVLSRIRSEEIHLALPLRPPAEAWVAPSHPDRIARAQEILGSAARVLPPIPEGVVFSSKDDIVEAVVNVISRHPMEEGDLIRALQNWSGSGTPALPGTDATVRRRR